MSDDTTAREEGALALVAPLSGWSTPLDEAPDAVFAGRILGDGVAIDPTAGTLCAPCDGELLVVAPSRHAVTLRTAGGCQILMHVGIDTVSLGGAGFTLAAQQGARVRSGDALLHFDLDLLARRAPSLLTPIVITADSGFRIVRRVEGREVKVGDPLMDLAPELVAAASVAAPGPVASQRAIVTFEHGIHARPAALLAASLKNLAADVRLAAGAREANARSTVSLMALGAQHGDEIEIRAAGPDAALAVSALAAVLGAEAAAPRNNAAAAPPPAAAAPAATTAAPQAGDALAGVIASR